METQTVFSLNLEITVSDRLAMQGVPVVGFCPPRTGLHTIVLCFNYAGAEIKSLCLLSKQFTQQAISPVLDVLFSIYILFSLSIYLKGI